MSGSTSTKQQTSNSTNRPKRILLVCPASGRGDTPIYPLGLAYIAKTLTNVEIRGCDLQFAENPQEALSRELREFSPDIIAISLRNIDSAASYDHYFYYPAFQSCVATAASECPRATVIVGGAGFSLFPKQIMQENLGIDVGVYVEGEPIFSELIAHIDCPQRISGVYFREAGRLQKTDAGPRPCFERGGRPDRSAFPLQPYVNSGAEIGVQTRRGCAFNCIYCTYPLIEGSQVRVRPVEDIVDELEELTSAGVKRIFFCDSIFNFPADHAEALCREMIRRGVKLKWRAYFNERYTTETLIQLAKEAGCDLLIFGPDAGHDITLARYRKGFKQKELLRVYAQCRKIGVLYRCAFMINGPGETLWTLLSLLWMSLVLCVRSRMIISLTTMRIYPHTELYNEALERGLIQKESNLLEPVFYDPFPLRMLSVPLSALGALGQMLLHRLSKKSC